MGQRRGRDSWWLVCVVAALLIAGGVVSGAPIAETHSDAASRRERPIVARSGGAIVRTEEGLRLRTRRGRVELKDFPDPACEEDVNRCSSHFVLRYLREIPAYVIDELLYEGHLMHWISGVSGARTRISDNWALSPDRRHLLGAPNQSPYAGWGTVDIWSIDADAELKPVYSASIECAIDEVEFVPVWRSNTHAEVVARTMQSRRPAANALHIVRDGGGWRASNKGAFIRDPFVAAYCLADSLARIPD